MTRRDAGAGPAVLEREGGFSLAELLVSAAASSLLLAALCALIVAQTRAIRLHLDRGRLAEALRVPSLVFAGELPLLVPAVDLGGVTGEMVALRAFRGLGLPCAIEGHDVLLRYAGLRQPEPAKDSVLVVAEAGAEDVRPLAGSGGGGAAQCEPREGERILRWRLPGAALPAEAVLLLFESGSYHLTAEAFRYRRGSSGRQPLTESILDDEGSGFRLLDPGSEGPGALELSLVSRIGARRPLRRTQRVRVPFLNGPPDG